MHNLTENKNEIVDHILSYMDFLRNTMHLQVSFCNDGNSFSQYMHLLFPYNFHTNSYCACLKTIPVTRATCIQKQAKIHAKGVCEPFYGTCWAGVEEYVFPMASQGKYLGFISVSGFRGNRPQSVERVRHVADRYSLDYNFLMEKYTTGLLKKAPDMDALKPVIQPLCDMFELLYITSAQVENTEIYSNILTFICNNFTEDITLKEISENCGYSPSYIRHVFSKRNNSTIKQYLIELRIRRAKEYLKYTNMSVLEIAFQVGFNDSNYFTKAFKHCTGTTPTQYRKAQNKLSANFTDFMMH